LSEFSLRQDEEGLSFYRTSTSEETEHIASLFSITLRDNPGHFEYVTVPDSDLRDFQLQPWPVPEHRPFLSARHYELRHPALAECRNIAEAFWSSNHLVMDTVRRNRVVEFAIERDLDRDQTIDMNVKWRRLIEKKRRRMEDHS
jgi:hypothetical protein